MKIKKKLLGSFLMLALVSQVFAGLSNAESSDLKSTKFDSVTESARVTKDFIKQKAIKEGKEVNLNDYETSLANAKSEEEKTKIRDNFKNSAVYSEVQYSDTNAMLLGTLSVPGDTRISTSYVYGQQTTYNSQSGQLSDMTNKLLYIGASYTHPVVGAFMSVLGLFIPTVQYASYNSTITSSILDYVIIVKAVEVYQWNGSQYIWAPMATTEKKNTSAQINTVYYKGAVRYTPTNLDLGLISGQAGSYFYDDAQLTSLAKNTLSPLYYSYGYGTIIGIDPSSKFAY